LTLLTNNDRLNIGLLALEGKPRTISFVTNMVPAANPQRKVAFDGAEQLCKML